MKDRHKPRNAFNTSQEALTMILNSLTTFRNREGPWGTTDKSK